MVSNSVVDDDDDDERGDDDDDDDDESWPIMCSSVTRARSGCPCLCRSYT